MATGCVIPCRGGAVALCEAQGCRLPSRRRGSWRIPVLVPALMLMVLALAAMATGDAWAQHERRFGEGLTFEYDQRDRALGERLWPLLSADRRQIMERLELFPPGTLKVLLAADAAEFAERLPGVPPGTLGVYVGSLRTIVLRAPRSMPGADWDIRGVARHELVHGILDLAIEEPLPRWLNEGLAVLVAEELSLLDDTRFNAALISNRLIPFAALVETFPGEDFGRTLAYQQAASFTRFLLARGGIYGIQSLVRAMAAGYTASQALEIVYGYGLGELERQWKQGLLARLSWLSILASSSLLGVVGAPLLVLAARGPAPPGADGAAGGGRRHAPGLRPARPWAAGELSRRQGSAARCPEPACAGTPRAGQGTPSVRKKRVARRLPRSHDETR